MVHFMPVFELNLEYVDLLLRRVFQEQPLSLQLYFLRLLVVKTRC